MTKLLLTLLLFTVIAGCSSDEGGAFSIRFPKNIDRSKAYSNDEIMKMELEDAPIITTEDIKLYYKDTNRIELTSAASDRIRLLGDTYTVPFVICVGDKRIYAGYFWSHLLSASYNGVVICPQLEPEDSLNIIRIQLGYPTADEYKGDDPRSDNRIMRSLEAAGKLAEKDETFSVYIPRNIDHSKLYTEDEIMGMELEDKPVIGMDDSFVYNNRTHEIRLSFLAFNRIMKLRDGTPFVACVGYERIYAGYFSKSCGSESNERIIICEPERTGDNLVRIHTGNTTKSGYKTDDPRSDPRIIRALKRGGNKVL